MKKFSPFKKDAEQLETLQLNKQENSDAKEEEMSEPMAMKSAPLRLDPNDLTEGERVQVNYEGKKFLENVVSIATNSHVNVRCLGKPFGVRESQQLERKDDTCFYNHVYLLSVTLKKLEENDCGHIKIFLQPPCI